MSKVACKAVGSQWACSGCTDKSTRNSDSIAILHVRSSKQLIFGTSVRTVGRGTQHPEHCQIASTADGEKVSPSEEQVRINTMIEKKRVGIQLQWRFGDQTCFIPDLKGPEA
jgi:hypothetical protein